MGYRQGEMVGDYRGRGGYGVASLAARGDPGLFGFLGKLIGGAAKLAIGATPFGRVANVLGQVITPAGAQVFAQNAARLQAQAPIGAVQLPPPPRLPTSIGRTVVKPRKGAWEPTEVLSAGHGLRPRRRMNVTNAKALRRAIRRARGFEKLARKVLGFTSPRKPKGRSYFRAAAKKR